MFSFNPSRLFGRSLSGTTTMKHHLVSPLQRLFMISPLMPRAFHYVYAVLSSGIIFILRGNDGGEQLSVFYSFVCQSSFQGQNTFHRKVGRSRIGGTIL